MKMVDRHVVGKCSHLFEEFARVFRQKRRFYIDDAARHSRARAALQQWMEEANDSDLPEL
jgi:hypothetical protein